MPKLYRHYADSYWDVNNEIMEKVQELGINNAVVFQSGDWFSGVDLSSGLLHNSPNLNDSVIFAVDLGKRNGKLKECFPNRTYYRAYRNDKKKLIIEPLDLH